MLLYYQIGTYRIIFFDIGHIKETNSELCITLKQKYN